MSRLSYPVLLSLWMLTCGGMCKTMVETLSSGSDCRCKCIINAKEGHVCRDGSRATVYVVETIPVGSDCRCSCNTPPPAPCENIQPEPESRNALLDDETLTGDEFQHNVAKLARVVARLQKLLTKSKAKVKPKQVPRISNATELIAFSERVPIRTDGAISESNKVVVPALESNQPRNANEPNVDGSGGAHVGRTLAHTHNTPNTPKTPTLAGREDVSTVSRNGAEPASDDESVRHGFDFHRTNPNKEESRSRELDFDSEEDYAYEYDDNGDLVTEKVERPFSTTSTTTTAATTTTTTTTTSAISESTASNSTDANDDYEDEYYDDFDILTTTATTEAAEITQGIGGIDTCGTLYRISRPRAVGAFGRREGAWMRDVIRDPDNPARAQRIYVTNYYFGNILLEFDDLDSMKKSRIGNSYVLSHKWIGTGHIVYNGSFYYNRAFSTSLIKYDLKRRTVTAWSRLPNAVYRTWMPRNWKGHFLVHIVAEEHGLWVIYPSRDPYRSQSKLTYIVNRINPVDLSVMESYKTKVRQSPSHFFMICGILYTTTGHDSRRATVTDAFDTKTMAKRSIYLGIENLYSYAVQFSYNPADKTVYAWDNGRQVEYNVILAQ